MSIVFSTSVELVGVHLGGADVTVSGGSCRMVQVTGIGDLHITNGTMNAVDVQCGAVTLDSGTGESLIASKLTCSGLNLNGGSGFQRVLINGLDMGTGQLLSTGDFDEWSITGASLGRAGSSGASQSIVSIDGLTGFKLEATVYRSARHGMVFDDCVAGDVFATIIDPSQSADNTYDGVSLIGANDGLNFYGSVRGAVNQANNPRYGFDAAAGTLVCDVWMAFSGYQTAATNDASGNVIFHT